MSTEETKKWAHRFSEEWNRGNLEGVIALIAQDFTGHNSGTGETSGAEGFRQSLRAFYKGLPDSKMTAQLVVAEGDIVTEYGTLTGTHKGDLFGAPPTGKKITITYIDIHRYKDGKIVEGWHLDNTLAMLQQLEALPAHRAMRSA
ncbi:MAG: ester cyclase [Omnitrophica WOR_2 bacterium]